MLRLIVFLLFLIASVAVGIMVLKHPGYVLLVYQAKTIQMPIWFAVLVGIVVLVAFYALITTVDNIHFLWYRFKNWLKFRREHKSYSKTQHGLALLVEARWKKAERLLNDGLKQSFEPLMNYLGAARAAQAQGAYERRNQYLRKAQTVAPDAIVAILLTKAELEIEHDEYDSALLTLGELKQKSPRHPRVLTLLQMVYTHLKDWQGLITIIPLMKKAKLLTADQYADLEAKAYSELLDSSSTKGFVEIQKIWNGMPRAVRKNPDVTCAYVKQLLRFSDTKEAEELIRKTLRNHWQPELAQIYGTLPFINLNRQLVIAGAWLKQYGQKPELLLTLGRLCMRLQLWGRAKDYLEKCLEFGTNKEASKEYDKLLEQLEKNYGIARNS